VVLRNGTYYSVSNKKLCDYLWSKNWTNALINMRTEKHTQSNFVGNLGITNSRITCIKLVSLCLAIPGHNNQYPKNITNNFSSSWEAYSYFLQRLRYRRIISRYLVTIGGLLVKLSCTYWKNKKETVKKVNIMDTIRIKCNVAKLLVTETVEVQSNVNACYR
jgi:hypothetical protein